MLRHELDLVLLPTKYAWPLLKRAFGAAIVMWQHCRRVRVDDQRQESPHGHQGAVIAMTRQLAAEGAPHGIRVNWVSPGMIRTPATESDLLAAEHPMSTIARHIPLGRIGNADEVVKCALFLASDDASYVTGDNLMVDGGWSAVLPGDWSR